MRNFLLRSAIVLAIIALASPSRVAFSSQQAHVSMAKKKSLSVKIDRYFDRLVSHESFSGSVLVARHGRFLLRKGYGQADRTHHQWNTRRTEFRIAGLTALFTATAILQLQERGKISVQERACTYLSGCPEAWQTITIDDLLNSSAGLYDPINQDFGFDPAKASPLTIVREAEQHPPVTGPRHPGGVFCNTCVLALDLIIEKASGEPFGTFLEQNIFRPLYMEDTGMDGAGVAIPNLAIPYVSRGQVAPSWVVDDSWFCGVHSTIEDLYTWHQALVTGNILSRRSLAAMFTVSHPEAGGSGQGYGWSIGMVAGRHVYGLDGVLPGAVSSLLYFPDDRITIIVLDNLPTWDIDQIVGRVYATLFGYY